MRNSKFRRNACFSTARYSNFGKLWAAIDAIQNYIIIKREALGLSFYSLTRLFFLFLEQILRFIKGILHAIRNLVLSIFQTLLR